MYWFQKSNIGDLQLGCWQSKGQQDYSAGRKKPEVRKKIKTYLGNPSLWLKRMTLREQENVFLLIWTYRTGHTKMFILT